MGSRQTIITVGVSPSWDVFCRVAALEWGEHKRLQNQTIRPAGKALNLSRALGWMGVSNTAAGLWGQDDLPLLREAEKELGKHVHTRFTPAAGRTRLNINVVDTVGGREFHLRAANELATKKSLRKLKSDLRKLVKKGSLCVFAGALPGGKLLEEVLAVIQACRNKGGHVVLDTSGAALKAIVNEGDLWLIKPNVRELGQLLGTAVANEPEALAKAGEKLLSKTEHLVISRGLAGAVAVTEEEKLVCRLKGRTRKAGSTVGCGDYMLAGILCGMAKSGDIETALQQGVQAGTARAWGLTEQTSWHRSAKRIRVVVKQL